MHMLLIWINHTHLMLHHRIRRILNLLLRVHHHLWLWLNPIHLGRILLVLLRHLHFKLLLHLRIVKIGHSLLHTLTRNRHRKDVVCIVRSIIRTLHVILLDLSRYTSFLNLELTSLVITHCVSYFCVDICCLE